MVRSGDFRNVAILRNAQERRHQTLGLPIREAQRLEERRFATVVGMPSAGTSLVEQLPNVTLSTEDSDHLQGLRVRSIDDEVLEDGPEPDRFAREVCSRVSESRVLSEQPHGVTKSITNPVGDRQVVPLDVVQDLADVSSAAGVRT